MPLLREPPAFAYEFTDGFRRFAIAKPGPPGLPGARARWLLEGMLRNPFLRDKLVAWYRRAEFTLGPVDDVRALETLLREVAAGWVHLYELEPAPRPVYTHRLPDMPRAPQPPVPLAVDEIVDTYEIEGSDGPLDAGTTRSDGMILVDLPTADPRVVLRLPKLGLSFALDVAALAPVSELAGAQGRLVNLGYPCPTTGELDDETREALRAFQRHHGLTTTGEPDGDTLAALRELHDL